MGRPKYGPGDATARDRLSNAYWEMLAGMPFDEITVRTLSQKAGVNHNTFYRHFQGMDQMAAALFDEDIVRRFSSTLFSIANGDSVDQVMEPDDARKVALYARSGSSLLTTILREAIERVWLEAVGVDPYSLTKEQQMDCDIIFGGIVAAMGDPRLVPGRDTLAEVLSRPLGKTMLATLRDIARTTD